MYMKTHFLPLPLPPPSLYLLKEHTLPSDTAVTIMSVESEDYSYILRIQKTTMLLFKDL